MQRTNGGRGDFGFALDIIDSYPGKAAFYSLQKVQELGHEISKLPYSIRVLLENAIRHSADVEGATHAAYRLLEWPRSIDSELPFMPQRVLLQDYTGVPLIVDLAAMRGAVARQGRDPKAVNSSVPIDLIIDHSVQVDGWGNDLAFSFNIEKEYERNSERYSLLKWAQSSFKNIRVFPPGKGICHQVNLEYLATVVALRASTDGRMMAFPDTLVGTDSHTTMINGLGVLGWGVGGIEAEAVMMGEPYHMAIPRVVGVRLSGSLREGVTPTDVVLVVTELLRNKNVVDAFVEYFGEGYEHLSVPDRATLGNMSPEYGATAGFSPVDSATLTYLLETGRDAGHVHFVEDYCRKQGLFAHAASPQPAYSEVLDIDLGQIEPSIAGPRNPDERRTLVSVPAFARAFIEEQRRSRPPPPLSSSSSGGQAVSVTAVGRGDQLLLQTGSGQITSGLTDGSVIIAAITSCTNTSNPTVMVGSGIIARNAVARGLAPKPFVKCSLAPGSSVVKDYLEGSGLLTYLDQLGFNLVGYGCTTCIGNSGPLAPEVENEIKERDLYTVAVLSGNRNFDGRIHPLAKGSFLMSPMLVVAYALVGRIDFDFYNEPLGRDKSGNDVYLRDLWPSLKEIKDTVESSLNRGLYKRRYANALVGDEQWQRLPANTGDTYEWVDSSTYIREPPWFAIKDEKQREDIKDARVLALLGDKITTDHISPAGSIPLDSPAGKYLTEHGVEMIRFSTYGSRRGNDEVMKRGGFANIRLKNLLAGEGKEGGYTKYFPSNEVLTIYDASTRYLSMGIPLIVLAGKQYGSGSSRDWAAKAPKLLGIRAVIAESFERIHRSNLVAMGVLPLEFMPGESVGSLGLKGDEHFAIEGMANLKPGATLHVTASASESGTTTTTTTTAGGQVGRTIEFTVKTRIDNGAEMDYYNQGGVLPHVFDRLSKSNL